MTSIQKPVGKITLRDFKALFDRPGFYRYHFKTMDKEFGMVKEEVRERGDNERIFQSVTKPNIQQSYKFITLERGNYNF